ncbi:MAG: capsule assembly Wzi family protein [Longimicrobiales bacterium]
MLRLHALGLLPAGYDPGDRTPPMAEVAAALDHAAQTDAGDVNPLIQSWRARFAEEYTRPTWSEGDAALRVTRSMLAAGAARLEGGALAGIGYDPATDWTGARAQPDGSVLLGIGDAAFSLGPRISVAYAPRAGARDPQPFDAYMNGLVGPLDLWLGRRALGYGAASSGLILSGELGFTGGGLRITPPVTLPGFLRALGPVGLQLFASRIDNVIWGGDEDRRTEPWFWAMRATSAPHPRLALGVARGVMFGGAGNSPATLRNIAYMLIGKHAGEQGEFDAQLVSLDARWAVPFRPLPLALYAEFGADDSAGALFDVPGYVLGLELPALPRLPQLALGVEHAAFARSCCGNTIWHRNWFFRGGWTDDGRPLGHGLAGHGSEWRARAAADLAAATLRLRADLFTRDRGDENLFAPERAGRSTGAGLSAWLRAASHLELEAHLTLEQGPDWRERHAAALLRWLF